MMNAHAAIAQACNHPEKERCDSFIRVDGADIPVCWRCANAAHAAWRAERKAQLAARPKDCARCGARPHTYFYGGHKLCGRCLTATKREHGRAMGNAGTLAIFATGLLVDTSAWAANGRQQ